MDNNIINTIDTVAKKYNCHVNRTGIDGFIEIVYNSSDRTVFIDINDKAVSATDYEEEDDLTIPDLKMIFDIYQTLGWL